jgi:uncharacterized protein (TIRG00374 family)
VTSGVSSPSDSSTDPASESAPGTSRRSTSRKNAVRRVLALALTGLVLYVLLPSISRVLGAWPRLAKLSPAWFAGAVVAEVISFVCTFGLQRIVLRTRGWFAVVAAGLTGNAVTNVVPGGSAVGAAVQFRMLATAGIDADNAAGGLAATSLLSVGGLLALPVIALPAILGGTQVSPGLDHAALLGLGAFGVFVLLGVVLMVFDRPLAMVGSLVQGILNHIPRRRKKTENLGARLLRQRDDIRAALGRNWLMAVLLIGGRLGFDYLCLLGVLRATGSNPRPSLVLLAYAAAGVIALVPLTPGGLGIVEASLSGLLVLAGVHAGSALVATLAYRLISYWLPLLAGPVVYFFYRRRFGPVQLEDHEHTTPKP